MKRLLKSSLFQNNNLKIVLNCKALSFAILLFSLTSSAQVKYANYVNNSSFESTLSSATTTPFDAVKFWGPLDSVGNAASVIRAKSLGTAPNNSFGYQMPRSGNNYVLSQFLCYPSTCSDSQRWYPRNRLKKTLSINTNYCVKFHIVNTNNCVVGINSYGAFFGGGWLDTTKKCSIPITYLTPQVQWQGGIITDTLNWVPITGTFVADGTEKYLVLGNFKSNAATQTLIINPTYLPALGTDIYIDDVSLIEMDLPAYAGRDTSVIPGDSIYLGYEQDIEINESCIWYKWPDMINPIDTIAGFWLKPVSNSTFVVRQQLWCSGVKWDTVVIHLNPVGMDEKLKIINEELRIFPVPAGDQIELKIHNTDLLKDFKTYSVYNSLGELLKEEIQLKEHLKINTSDLQPGVYFLYLNGNSMGAVSRRFVISR